MIVANDKVVSLGAYIKQAGAEGLYQHSKFAKGVAPSGFVPKKPSAYTHSDDSCEKVWASVKGKGEYQMLWFVRLEGGKILPNGVALVNSKQIIAKAAAAAAAA